jgi:diguanylate cyclase (GGDEF)-like protein
MNALTVAQVLASPKLPSLPAAAVRIIELVQHPDVSLPDLARAISLDPSLAGKILRTANSSFYARPKTVSKLSDALMVLGLRRVKTLALGFSLVDIRHKSEGFDYVAFWHRSLYTATAARVLALSVPKVDPEEALLGGLLHALGVPALYQAGGEEYHHVFQSADGNYRGLLDAESLAFGFNHATLGGALAERWNLPPQLSAVLRHFPAPERAAEELRPLVECVRVGTVIAEIFTGANPSAALAEYRQAATESFGIRDEQADQLLSRVQDDAKNLRELFDLPAAVTLDVREILVQANEMLENIALDAERRYDALEGENERLELDASTDPLTGVANRRGLMRALNHEIALGLAAGHPVAFLLADLDYFKNVNDIHGHLAGDVVLKAVASALSEGVREAGTVGRYGGEEFGVVIPNVREGVAEAIADRLRERIEALDIACPPGPQLAVTISIGIAMLEPKGRPTAEMLIGAADRALYEAKDSGRNATRVARTPFTHAA